MKFTTFFTALLLAVPSLAAPRGNLIDRARARSPRLSHPIESSKEGANIKTGSGNQSDVVYSSNWSGVVRQQPPPGANYTTVTATFNVPQAIPVGGGNGGGMQAASAWVGIDGDTSDKAILQTGVDSTVENGKTTHHAWYEWYPDYAHDFSMEVNAGDTIVATVRATSPSDGVAILENKSNGQSATKTLAAPNPTATLEGKNAEWIVEDFEMNGSMVALVDFGTVSFTGAEAGAGGSSYGVSNATKMELFQDGKTHSKVQVHGESSFDVHYIK